MLRKILLWVILGAYVVNSIGVIDMPRNDEIARLMREAKPQIKAMFEPAEIAALLAAPRWSAIKQIGTQLHADWDPVYGADYYELWSNTAPTPTGATLVKTIAGSQYTMTLNQGVGELLNNGGFESGSLFGADLQGNAEAWAISSLQSHSAPYAAYVNGFGALQFVVRNVRGGSSITISFWRKVTAATNAGLDVNLIELDANDNLTAITLLTTLTSTDSVWTKHTTTLVLNPNTSYLKLNLLSVQYLPGGVFTGYFDDFSIVGYGVAIGSNLRYAVRAVNTLTQSPYSTWLQPTRAPAAVGTPDGLHVEINYDEQKFAASRFAETEENGWKADTEALRGGFMRAGRLGGWGPFLTTSDAIARGLATDESDAVGFAVGDYPGGKYILYTAALGLVLGNGVAVPTGALIPYAAASAPSGYLLCNGAAVSRTTYGALFALISTTYGAGDGSTTFNVPDLRGRMPVGYAPSGGHTDVDALGDNDGAALSSRTPKHAHAGPSHTHAQNMGAAFYSESTTGPVGATSSNNADMVTHGGSGGLTGNEVRTGVAAGGTGATGSSGGSYLAINFIIKT